MEISRDFPKHCGRARKNLPRSTAILGHKERCCDVSCIVGIGLRPLVVKGRTAGLPAAKIPSASRDFLKKSFLNRENTRARHN